jgi:hypothetical protein
LQREIGVAPLENNKHHGPTVFSLLSAMKEGVELETRVGINCGIKAFGSNVDSREPELIQILASCGS